MMKDKKAITLVTLIVTVIIMLILAGVTIATITNDNFDSTIESQENSEMYILQNVLFQKYSEYKQTNNSDCFIGEFTGTSFEYKIYKNSEVNYFKQLGLSGKNADKYTYIVNYKTGTVENETLGIKIGGYNTNKDGEQTSYVIDN